MNNTPLTDLRQQIDQIDADIIKMLAKRQQLSVTIGKVKKQQQQALVDPHRESQLANQHLHLCQQYQLDYSLVKKIFTLIIGSSKQAQARQ